MNNNSNSDTSKVMKTRFELPKTAQSRNKSDRTENYARNIQERIQHGKKNKINFSGHTLLNQQARNYDIKLCIDNKEIVKYYLTAIWQILSVKHPLPTVTLGYQQPSAT